MIQLLTYAICSQYRELFETRTYQIKWDETTPLVTQTEGNTFRISLNK